MLFRERSTPAGSGPDGFRTGAGAVLTLVGVGLTFALLTWRTCAGWADAETPQTVTAGLDAASPQVDVPITGSYGRAPFDIADGGTWAIAPWAQPWN